MTLLSLLFFAFFGSQNQAQAARPWGCEWVGKSLSQEVKEVLASPCSRTPLAAEQKLIGSCAEAVANPELQNAAKLFQTNYGVSCVGLNKRANLIDEVCKEYLFTDKLGAENLAELKILHADRPWAGLMRMEYFTRILNGVQKRFQRIQEKVNPALQDSDPAYSSAQDLAALANLGLENAKNFQAAAASLEESFQKEKQAQEECFSNPECSKSEKGKAFRESDALPKLAAAKEACGKASQLFVVPPALGAGFQGANAKLSEVAKAMVASADFFQRGQREQDGDLQKMRAQAAKETARFLEAQAPGIPATAVKAAGMISVSFYNVAQEHDLGEEKTRPVYDSRGKVIAKVSERFYRDKLDMEGTARLADGRLLNIIGYVKGKKAFEVMPEEFPFGLGRDRMPLVPFQSVAVDPKVIPVGSELYVPMLYGMKYMDEHGNYRIHDGRLKAVDVGGAIKGKRMDLFTSAGDQSYFFRVHGVVHGAEIGVFFLKKPRK